jgi:hypothetical protein
MDGNLEARLKIAALKLQQESLRGTVLNPAASRTVTRPVQPEVQ